MIISNQDSLKLSNSAWAGEIPIQLQKMYRCFLLTSASEKVKAGPHRARRGTAPRFCYSTKQGEKCIWCGHNIRIYQCKPIALRHRERERARCGPAITETPRTQISWCYKNQNVKNKRIAQVDLSGLRKRQEADGWINYPKCEAHVNFECWAKWQLKSSGALRKH